MICHCDLALSIILHVGTELCYPKLALCGHLCGWRLPAPLKACIKLMFHNCHNVMVSFYDLKTTNFVVSRATDATYHFEAL